MQFDVYPTPGRAREVFPFLIDVQSDLAHDFKTRYVVPLLPLKPGVRAVQRANPRVEFDGCPYLFVANQLANIECNRMGRASGNLAHYRDELLAAVDFMLMGY